MIRTARATPRYAHPGRTWLTLHKLEKRHATCGDGLKSRGGRTVAIACRSAKAPTIADQVFTNQNGVCTIAQWRSGHCASTTEVFDIPFSQLGEFVYHCHILEHEDGGMMARIVVVPASN
jgi:plastocyanin